MLHLCPLVLPQALMQLVRRKVPVLAYDLEHGDWDQEEMGCAAEESEPLNNTDFLSLLAVKGLSTVIVSSIF